MHRKVGVKVRNECHELLMNVTENNLKTTESCFLFIKEQTENIVKEPQWINKIVKIPF